VYEGGGSLVCIILSFALLSGPQSAFRTKAKEFHPDQNQDNKEAAEAKFKAGEKEWEKLTIK
ncbi:hypothetical protein FRX31_024853, partial [Thalictrum thalictroides]